MGHGFDRRHGAPWTLLGWKRPGCAGLGLAALEGGHVYYEAVFYVAF
jgi:hypothetical protein